MIRFVITAIKADGLRQIAFDNNGRNTYETREEAQKHLDDVLANNSPETISAHVGTKLNVLPVDCWDSGDAKMTIFPN